MLPLALLTIQSVMNNIQEPNQLSPICKNMHTREGGISKAKPPFYWKGGYGCLALVAPPTITLFMLTERIMQFAMILFTKNTLSDKIDFKAIHDQEENLFIKFRNKYSMAQKKDTAIEYEPLSGNLSAYQDGEKITGYKEIVPEKSKYTEEEIQKSREFIIERLDFLENERKSQRFGYSPGRREEFVLDEKDNDNAE